jgi:predicted Zn finger-like uncharacterized protein
MLITCPNCATSYDVSAASLGAEGRSVRCVRCQEVWFATPTAAPATAGGFAGAAVSAYRHGAASAAPGPEPDGRVDDVAAEDAFSDVDANLAARAADRAHVEYDGPSALDDAAGVDAHDSPPLAPGPGDAAVAAAPMPGEDIESIAARRARREMVGTGRRRLRPSLTMLIVVLIAVNGVLVGWRTDVVRLMPQTAPLFAAIGLPVNLRGLAFEDVTTSIEASENVPVLLVKGRITNISRQPHDVTRLRFGMRNAAGNEVYAWTSLPARGTLAPGDSEPVETRLASPPADGQSVVVRFFTRRDLVAGAR